MIAKNFAPRQRFTWAYSFVRRVLALAKGEKDAKQFCRVEIDRIERCFGVDTAIAALEAARR